MSSVTIVYPNARRCQIKIQPITKVLEIIEEACKRQGLNSDEHILRYQKRSLDISLTFRMTGIANNTTLELEKLDVARKFKDITLVLQLSDGTKLSPKNFKPDTTTFEQVLCAYKAESELLQSILACQETDLYPTCSFMNEQIIGDYQLRNTTLKDMGLLTGRGLIRLDLIKLDREAFEKKSLDFEQKLEKKSRLDKIYEEKKSEELIEMKKMEERFEQAVESKNGDNNPTAGDKPAIQSIQSNSKEIIDIIEKKPVAGEFSNFKFVNENLPTKVDKKNSVVVRAPQLKIQTENEFAAFKFPEATKGKVCNDLGEIFEMEKESREICDRQAVVVNMNVAPASGSNESEPMDMDQDLPEDVFDVTLQDLKSMLGSLKKAQNEESIMMTKQMREQEQDLKALKYPNTAIRICFSNRTFLQGIFRPKETVSALYKFVRENLSDNENSQEDLDFILYTSPPRKDINNNKDTKKTLFEHQLCPAAQIYFKNKSGKCPRLIDDTKFVSSSEAQQIVYSTIHQNIRQVEDEGLNFLKKEQTAASKILKTSSIAGNILGQGGARTSNSSQSQSHYSSGSEDPTKKKMGSLFLGKKK